MPTNPMPRVPADVKQRLKDEGQWESYWQRYNELKATMKPGMARRQAVMEFTSNNGEGGEGSFVSSESPEQSTAENSNPGLGSLPSPPASSNPSDMAMLCDFGGKRASEPEIIRWVARHMEVADVQPIDAPDPIAWGLLLHCRQYPTAKADFWKTTFPKLLPSRAQMEEAKPEDMDGQSQVDVIDQIKEIRRKADQQGAGA